jgi:hypothetical protein
MNKLIFFLFWFYLFIILLFIIITPIMRRAIHLFGNAIRETGQAFDRFGLIIAGNDRYKDTFSRHRSIMNIFDKVMHLLIKQMK